MIYMTMKTHLGQTFNFATINSFIDYLETSLMLNFDSMSYTPNKHQIKIILEESNELDVIETDIKSRFKHPVEWEVYNENSDERYIAQLKIGSKNIKVLKTFLLVLFPEDYIFRL